MATWPAFHSGTSGLRDKKGKGEKEEEERGEVAG
jgi:hypothetical protein